MCASVTQPSSNRTSTHLHRDFIFINLPVVGTFADDKVQELVEKRAVGSHDRSWQQGSSLRVRTHRWMLCLVQVVERSRWLASHDRQIRGHLFRHSRLVQPLIGPVTAVWHDARRRFWHADRLALGNGIASRVDVSVNQIGVVEISWMFGQRLVEWRVVDGRFVQRTRWRRDVDVRSAGEAFEDFACFLVSFVFLDLFEL